MEVITAGIIVIGDEVLKGEVQESNAFYMCCHLRQLGVKVVKVTVIGDDIDEIASHVLDFSKKFNYVFTTGGIGPTHDDLTYEGIAKAFQEPLVCNKELLDYWDSIYSRTGWNLDKTSWKRMATVPANAKVVCFPSWGPKKDSDCVVVVSNIFVLPGVPRIIKRIFLPLAKECVQSNNVYYSTMLYLSKDEELVMPYLNPIVDKFKNRVIFGSYPIFSNLVYNAKVSVESSNREDFKEAVAALKSSIPQAWQVSIVEVAAENIERAIASFPFISKSVEKDLLTAHVGRSSETSSRRNIYLLQEANARSRTRAAVLGILDDILKLNGHSIVEQNDYSSESSRVL